METREPAPYRYTESGLPNVTLLRGVTVRECPKCGERIVSIPRMAELHRLLARKVASQRARLSGAEIRFLRKSLGWSGVDFARTIGVNSDTVSKWENEKERMGVVAERLLRLMAITEKPVEEYEKLADVAQDDAPKARLQMSAGAQGWQAEADAA
jgi:putative zinc finger/helix-turn-helix YgiT family protein